mgnify:FL=1
MEKVKFLISGKGINLQDKLNDIIDIYRNNDRDVEYKVLGIDDQNNIVVEVTTTSYLDDDVRPAKVMYNTAIIDVPAGREETCTSYLISEYEPLGVSVVLNHVQEISKSSEELFYSFYMKRRVKNKTNEF